MRIFRLLAAGITAVGLLSTTSNASTMTINLDATTNVAAPTDDLSLANPISVNLAAGNYRIDVVKDLFTAMRFTNQIPMTCDGSGANCGDAGWTIQYLVWDASSTVVQGFNLGNSYLAPDIALSEAQAFGPRYVSVATDAIYYFTIGDHYTSGWDNEGGVSLSITSVPLPASGFLLLGACAGIAGMRKRSRT